MFEKVLIANRGAIATRIIRTLKAMGVKSVAVYAQCDEASLHVLNAEQSICLGDGGAPETYLNIEKIISIAKQINCQAIHPGYGFLSENAQFVQRCEQENIVFIGPTAQQMQTFGLKHKARAISEALHVPLLPGTPLLESKQQAIETSSDIGFPVMLKSTAGGGGIGMQICYCVEEVASYYDKVKHLSEKNFSDGGVFVEKFIEQARHIEVQAFGDGKGNVITIGERDCSAQRRNQKVIEECPAANLSDELRQQLYATAEKLLSAVEYRNAGTVEFILDANNHQFYFLEVNTRLQVEHGVTEEVYGIDLVEWMIQLAADEIESFDRLKNQLAANGHAIQVRLYAEDPFQHFQPSADLLSEVYFPQDANIRIDTWVEAGVEVPIYFDSMLAKVIVHEASRTAALTTMNSTLEKIKLYGCETNLSYLQALMNDSVVINAEITTRYLNDYTFNPPRIDVIEGGTQTSIQDYPSRQGYWHVGVPPSGPFDTRSFRLANRLLENPETAAGLEIAVHGPTLRFNQSTVIVLSGADIEAHIDNQALAMWKPVVIESGQVLTLGKIKDAGMRSYLCIKDGIQCPQYLGSRSTFSLGQFGGHNGRCLRAGDVLHYSECREIFNPKIKPLESLALEMQSRIAHDWKIKVIVGPHGAPDFFTQEDVATFFNSQWEVHYNSSRTGVRLIGPKPSWARADGGEAGLHPSNIHDNAYAFGSIDFTGDMPVILGPDGPSLGGFVCPATVIHAELWKIGQLKPGDRIQFVAVSIEQAVELESLLEREIKDLCAAKPLAKSKERSNEKPMVEHLPIIINKENVDTNSDLVFRAAGDHFLLVEFGKMVLDIELRFRVHALMQWLEKNRLAGMRELTPGIRSLQIHYDSQEISFLKLVEHIKSGEQSLENNIDALSVPSRIVHIPLSWNDEACQKAIEKYEQTVRSDAPWCPSNLEFIRRINGLNSIDDVKQIVFDASYLVMGLGDVYLGAPVATPVNPKHRLVTTKYNPARTWTAENSVGIGGSYMCVYGMEGPGGYQFVGRTLQMWNRYKKTREFENPWLLRFFDQIQFFEVSNEELIQIRQSFPKGEYALNIEETQFSLADYQQLLIDNESQIETFQTKRQQAFQAELDDWHATGKFNFEALAIDEEVSKKDWPESSKEVLSPLSGSIWQLDVEVGQNVSQGDNLLTLESMKMEIAVNSNASGTVSHILSTQGKQVKAGQVLVVIEQNEVM